MLRLHTFGTVHLTRDGELLGGAAQQRRLLALLAALAGTGNGGTSRDKLLALFWPEGEPDKARRALNQSLYHVRKELGEENLFLGSAELRLNSAAITSDVGDFDRLLAEGALAEAVELYGGPFLDGFFLTGNSEFEEWSSTGRSRYAAQYIRALDKLAAAAKAAGDVAEEARSRRLRVDADPIDGSAVVALMESLIALGNRADALSVARLHEERMLAMFELPADEAVVELAKSLRNTPAGTPQLNDIVVPTAPAYSFSALPQVLRSRFSVRQLMSAAAAASVILVGAGFAVARHLTLDRADLDTSMLIVAPFRTEGSAGPDKAYLTEGLLDMLSTRLAAADAKRTPDASKVLSAWRNAGFTGSRVPTTVEVSRVARLLGGRQIVTGSVGGEGRDLSVQAELLDVDHQTVTSRVSVHGSADSLGSLVDRVVSGLVLGEAGESDRIRVPPDLSPAALHTYLQGAVAYRRGDFQAATRYFSQAVANDPTFALAALDLAIAADRANAAEQHDRGLALAWAGRAELAARDSAYLIAYAGPHYPAPSPATEHLAAWQHVVELDPNRPDGWFELAQSYFYDGEALGIADAKARAEQSVRHALAVDSTFAPAARFLPVVLVNRGDVNALRKLLAQPGVPGRWGDLRVYLTWRIALLLRDQRTLKVAREGFPRAPLASLRAIALTSQIEGIAVADGDRALSLLQTKAVTDREILDGLVAMHSRALNAGDTKRVQSVMEEIRKTEPAFHVDARLSVLDALYGGGDLAAGSASAKELVDHLASEHGSTPADSAVRVADACALAQWDLGRNDTTGVRSELRLLRMGGAPTFPVPVGANPIACADILDAALAPPAKMRAQLLHADSLMLSGPAVGAGLRQANLILARLFEREGESTLALETLRRWQYPKWWPRYRNTQLQEEARLALQTGDSAIARWALAQSALLRVPIGTGRDTTMAERSSTLSQGQGKK